jgi:transposase
MENVLSIYERPYDSRYPVICFDERPCQLIGDVLVPVPMKPGKPKREDYHYKRNGTCCVLMTVEPLTGKRIIRVTKQKTKKDYAKFMRLVEKKYSKAEKIILVQDNLNTHNPSSFYETFDAREAFELTQRFEMIYTPKKASWLNMVEIDFSALSKQCLNRRIADISTLTKEVYTWGKERTRLKVKIRWQFTKSKAREKLDRHYNTIRN